MTNRYLKLFFLLLAGIFQACGSREGERKEALFAEKDSTQTGIGFVNHVVPNDKVNLMDYLYFYNGAGVATGDINNDGLTDIYFVSNQGKNKLYLNKGNFKFVDITEKAGVEGFSDWQTGVTMADVNGDGLLDIYVSAVGNFRGMEGSNELYINNGNETFTEKAADYGLDFTGFSTQAVFFDYDKDGDLDCYLLNHAVHTSRSYDRVSTRNLRNNEAGDYLYESHVADSKTDSGKPVKFTDVSERAGIYGAAMGYGLGVSVADLNNDGWDDIYVSNDFHEDDYCYLNNGNGTFTESGRALFRYTSRYSMGNDIADVNNDGFPDVMTLDMYPEDEFTEKTSIGEDPLDIFLYKLSFGYMPQLSRNCLQINQSGKRFSELGVMAGVAATDWSWSPLLADYDNDGIKDLFVTNGIARRPNNLDYAKYAADDSLRYAPETSSDLDKKALEMMPEGRVHNYLFKGTRDLIFQNKSLDWGFEKPGLSSGAAYADFDNDGDLDLVTNNVNEPSRVYQNNLKLTDTSSFLRIKLEGFPGNTFAIGAKVVIRDKGELQMLQLGPTRGFESASEPIFHFGLGNRKVIDSLLVMWPNQKMQVLTNVKSNQILKIKYEPQQKESKTNDLMVRTPDQEFFENVSDRVKIPFKHAENKYFDFYRESLMPFLVSSEGPKLAIADVNGDGLDDFYVGGAKWQSGSLFIQTSGGKFKLNPQVDFQADSTYEDVNAVFFDANRDGYPDLYVVSGGNEFYDKMPQQYDRLYFNDGKGNFKRDVSALPPMPTNKSCAKPFDIDNDGDLDLFVGGRVVAFQYGNIPDSYILINDGKGHFSDQTMKIAPELRNVGMVTDAVWADVNGDKQKDLVVVGDWMPVSVFLNNNGKLKKDNNKFSNSGSGFWQCIEAADFDKDGDIDFVVGNLGSNTKLKKHPDSHVKMWVKDMDQNQGFEQIVAYSVNSKWYPIAGKDDLGKRIPGIINKRFTNYKTFAGKTIDELFKEEELEGARIFEVNKFESVLLENTPDGFKVKDLPAEAQYSKMFAWNIRDINGDGMPDIIGGGNLLGVNPYQGRYDSSYGVVLINDKKGGFTSMSPIDTGFLLDGEVRDIKTIRIGGVDVWMVADNNQPLQLFEMKKAEKSVVRSGGGSKP